MSLFRRCAVVAGGALAIAALASAAPAQASPPAPAAAAPHAFGHKVTDPTVQAAHARARRAAGLASVATGTGLLYYHGGIDGIGVTTGKPQVYLVVWGSQWGTQGTDSAGNLTFSADPSHEAPTLQKLFKGIGTGNEQWSGVMTQYCEGISSGATSCPAASTHVGYPSGGALAGVWADVTNAAPAQATDNQLATEAVAAAAHFWNHNAAANRDAQYVVVSPHGLEPGGFGTASGNFCAWHAAASSTYGDIAFTNLPDVLDAGASCGAGYVHAGAAGALDGVTLVLGHEVAETLTDQIPPGGWTDSVGYEIADKCSWIGVGGSGGAQDVALATGSFPLFGLWSNDGATCTIAHAVVTTVSPTELTIVGAADTDAIMARVAAEDATNAVDIPPSPTTPVTVPGDASCGAVTFGPGGTAAPATSADGLAVLAATLAGTYPNPTADAGRGCVDVVRSDSGPGGP